MALNNLLGTTDISHPLEGVPSILTGTQHPAEFAKCVQEFNQHFNTPQELQGQEPQALEGNEPQALQGDEPEALQDGSEQHPSDGLIDNNLVEFRKALFKSVINGMQIEREKVERDARDAWKEYSKERR